MEVPTKLKNEITKEPVILPLGVYPKEMESVCQ
jgi:hypothetical protein